MGEVCSKDYADEFVKLKKNISAMRKIIRSYGLEYKSQSKILSNLMSLRKVDISYIIYALNKQLDIANEDIILALSPDQS